MTEPVNKSGIGSEIHSSCAKARAYCITVLILGTLLGGWIIAVSSWDIMSALLAEHTVHVPRDWGLIVAFNVLGLTIVIGSWALVIAQIRTEFSDEGISQPGLFGGKTLRWSEIDRVVIRGPYVELIAATTTLRLSLATYKDGDCVIRMLRERIPWAR